MRIPSILMYEYDGKVYLVLEEGQESNLVKMTYLVEPYEIEGGTTNEDGHFEPQTTTKYRISKKVYDQIEDEIGSRDNAIRRATSLMMMEWSTQNGNGAT